MTTNQQPIQRLGKSALSMFLRTNCDRELYFSLYRHDGNRNESLVATGIPPALSARPNVQLVTQAGREFEAQELDMLRTQMGTTNVIFNLSVTQAYVEIDLAASLNPALTPGFYLQPALNPELFRNHLLCTDFGLSAAEEALIPWLSGLRPDLIIARARGALAWEVLPSGRRQLLAQGDNRVALSVVDIKNTLEGNRSYAAEVVFYAMVLARWIIDQGLNQQFFVSDECFLWTHKEGSALDGLPPTATIGDKLNHLLAAMERVEYAVIAPSVVRFFKEDLPRVIAQGNAHGWQSVDYHVGPRCGSCDWLGYDRWLTTDDRNNLVGPHPDWYCMPLASQSDHLSRMPNLSRGARKVLEAQNISTTTQVAALQPNAPVLASHSILKRERANIPARAQAIITNTQSSDATAVLAGLARDRDLEVSIAVNFDSAAGCLTGIAFRATVFMPYGSTPPLHNLPEFRITVENPTSASEWDAILAFLTAIDNAVSSSQRLLNGTLPRTQIYFWESRQFEELCAAIGRHIPRIFGGRNQAQVTPRQRALAWLFPPEELMEREAAVSPHVIFVGDLASRVIRIPAAHAFTLRDVHEHYHHTSLTPHRVDQYFIDPLGNGIPRERIFEVWKNTGTIRRGAAVVTKTQAAADYMTALREQSYAIASVVARLRQEYRGNLRGSARQLSVSNPVGRRGVAFDANLWITWAEVQTETQVLERKAQYTLPAEVLEADYNALVLIQEIQRTSLTRATYQVSPDSGQAKLDDDGQYFVLGSVGQPGFPLLRPADLGLPQDPLYGSAYNRPIYSLIRCAIRGLDRISLTADVEVLPRDNYAETVAVFNGLATGGMLPLQGDLFLMESKPYDDTEITDSILRAIGNPPCAVADPMTLRAMARANAPAAGNDPVSPAASVLWDAGNLAATVVRTPAQGNAIARRATELVSGLDASQEAAIREVCQKQLSLIWGPPGTGKTTTLVSYVMAIAEEAVRAGISRKILLTGPNYRAVEVLVHKLHEHLHRQTTIPTELFMVYSKSRPVVNLPNRPAVTHVSAAALSLRDAAAVQAMVNSFNGRGISIFGTSAHTIQKLVQAITNNQNILEEAFDVVVIDESSQVPVNLALQPLAALKSTSEIVIAGDPKQMPPVQPLAAPVGAEHMVQSIHNYIITRFPAVQQRELLFNYRSGRDLVEYAKTLGYPIGLTANYPDRRLRYSTPLPAITMPAGLPTSRAWEDILDPAKVACTILYDDPQSSQANIQEARMVAALAFTLRQWADPDLAPSTNPHRQFSDQAFIEQCLGVVTPHKAQRALVLAQLAQLFGGVPHEVLQQSVDTVERFQGGERDCIIVSFGVGDVDVIQGEEEFLLQLERTNVAISRARAKCIVIMPKSLAYHLPNEKRVSETAVALKTYVEEFCHHRAIHPVVGGPDVELRWH